MSGLEQEFFINTNTDESTQPLENSIPPTVRPSAVVCFDTEARQRILKAFDKDSERDMQDNINDVMHSAQVAENNYLKNARLLMKNGEYSLALNLIREALSINSKSGDAIKLLGECFLGQGKTQEAIQCFKSLVKIDVSFDSLNMLAKAYYSNGDDNSALDFYMKALEMQVFDDVVLFEIYKNIGNIYVRAGDLDTARENYNKAYTINPDSEVLLVNFGTLEIQQSHWGEAVDFFRRAVKINPSFDKAWMGLALVHREYGDHELAWANIEKCLDYNPQNDIALKMAVGWAFRDGKTQKIISRLEDYLEKNGSDISVSILLAQILYDVGQVKHARLEIERVLSFEPTNVAALDLMKLMER